jgi:lysozyme
MAYNLNLIKKFEGCQLEAYPDPGTGAEPWTIGYGTTIYPATGKKVQKSDAITLKVAEDLLVQHVAKYIIPYVETIFSNYNDNQKSAICSLIYNIGVGAFDKSNLKKAILANDIVSTMHEWGDNGWLKAGGKVMLGLARRRLAELNLFFS